MAVSRQKRREQRAEKAGYESYGAWISELEEERGVPICGAWSKTQERPCKKDRVKDNQNGRCHIHKGGEQRGVANPNFKHGKYSETLGGILQARYEKSLAEGPDQLSLGEQIALIDALEGEAVEDLMEARREDEGEQEAAAKGTIVAAAEQRRKLVEAERRRIEAAHEAVSRERLLAFVAYLTRLIRRTVSRHVKDEAARRAILEDISDGIGRLESEGAPGPGRREGRTE